MGLTPVSTRWFQLLCPIDEVASAVEALARTGHVEVESEGGSSAPAPGPELMARLDAIDALAHRLDLPWPSALGRGVGSYGDPAGALARGLATIEAWAADAEPWIERVRALELELAQLEILSELLREGGEALPELSALSGDHPILTSAVLALAPDAADPVLPPGVVVCRIDGSAHALFVVVGPRSAEAAIERAAELAHARRVPLPDWLPDENDAALSAIDERTLAAESALVAARAALDAENERHGLRPMLSDMHRLAWYVHRVPPSRQTRSFAVVSGWTDASAEELEGAIGAARLHALVTVGSPPPGRRPPVVLDNVSWVKPFETFARLVGVPSAEEVDPSALLSIIAPLLFGYMFADIGHGFVLLIVGLALRRRFPALAMLVPGGLSAMFFGLLFGTIFTSEQLLSAWWLHPLDEPLTVLIASIAGGAAILTIGLLLSAVGAARRHELGRHLRTDAAVAVIYVALLGMVFDRRSGLAALVGLAWFFLGHLTLPGERRWARALGELGHLAERMFQLAVNTVSFARVGAFALAHAGLSAAVAGMTQSAGTLGAIFVFLVGNLVILVIEGLVVGIQTTRLVLFEFFVRFLVAEGRPFVPLLPPAVQEDDDDTFGIGASHDARLS